MIGLPDRDAARGRLYGTVKLKDGTWHITADPHVFVRLKRLFDGIAKMAITEVCLSNTPEHCRDLQWFLQRYPMCVEPAEALALGANAHRDQVARVDDLLSGYLVPGVFALAEPARDYQAIAATLLLTSGGLLLGDELGIGKTISAIATFTDVRTLPALVVCQPHLIDQWVRQINRFAPNLTVYVVPGTKVGKLPQRDGRGPDVVIATYHRIAGWAQVLVEYCKSVIFEEVSELRRSGSQKYAAADRIARAMRFRLGLSATPIFNYGGEIFWVMNALKPGCLGTRDEFLREWCTGHDDKAMLRNPEAFSVYLREQGFYLRRTRKEVGRELPPITRTTYTVSSDHNALAAAGEACQHLARIILGKTSASTLEVFHAAGELDARLRQATGISKAVSVAAFVQMLFETTGEPIILTGWHRAVYDIWVDCLAKAGLRIALYTGSESPSQKTEVQRQFCAGELDVIILSLRSGLGLDGLQERCATIVHGELDWSWAVHAQCDGRPHRDGQTRPVSAYYLVCNDGSDPVIAETLGIKRDQLDGLLDPTREQAPLAPARDEKSIKRLAEVWMKQAGHAAKEELIEIE